MGRSLRASRWIVALCAILIAAGCGKKGPPLAPFVRVPAGVGAVSPQRFGDDVFLSFTVPSTNADGQKPATLASLEVYAVTSDRAPATEEQREVATLIATLPVREILPPLPVPANGSPPPPPPLLPGVDQGASVAIRETLTAELRVPVELPVDEKDAPPKIEEESAIALAPFGPVVAPEAMLPARRHYYVVAVSPRGRESTPSSPVAVPLESASDAPGKPDVTYTISAITIAWTPSPNARTSTFLPPPAVKPVAGANATPSNTTPKAPAPLAPIQARAFGLSFDTQATRYNLYDVTPVVPTEDQPAPGVYGITLPAPVNTAPLLATETVLKGVVFGVERCFEVRPVDQLLGTTVIGPASPTTCFTPQDTFPPVAPRNLAAIAGLGVISLIWDANTESDLAGYIVLRGDAPGATLRAITPQPITVTSYRDETVTPGTRYVYAVVAVDKAVPQNVSAQSNRAEETARQ